MWTFVKVGDRVRINYVDPTKPSREGLEGTVVCVGESEGRRTIYQVRFDDESIPLEWFYPTTFDKIESSK